MNSEAITARYEMPFRVKHQVAPSRAYVAPPMVGPRMRARLNWIEFMAMALARSSGPTRVGSSAEYAGPPKDWPTPTMNERVRMCQIWTTWVKNKNANKKAQAIWMYWEVSNIFRLSRRSAKTPPNRENMMMGSWPRKKGSLVIS